MNLTDKALLVQLNIRQWTARKLDKRATAQVAAANNARNDAGRYNKVLLPGCATLDAVHKMSTVIRAKFYANTLPWGVEGTSLLPTGNYLRFVSEFRADKAQWEQLVDDFLQDYGQMQAEAPKVLGKLFDPADYPPVGVIQGKFNVDLAVMPVPSADFRVAVGDAELARIRSEVEARVNRAQENAMADLWQRLYDKVALMAERLSVPEGRVYDSLVDNVRDLCDLLPRLNFANDARLEDMRREVLARLGNTPVQTLRDDMTVRADAASAARDIMARMGAFMGA